MRAIPEPQIFPRKLAFKEGTLRETSHTIISDEDKIYKKKNRLAAWKTLFHVLNKFQMLRQTRNLT